MKYRIVSTVQIGPDDDNLFQRGGEREKLVFDQSDTFETDTFLELTEIISALRQKFQEVMASAKPQTGRKQ